MRHVATALYVLVGLINLFPVVGVLGAARLESLYGVAVTDPDLLLMMRHRAVLLGITGALVLVAAFRSQWRTVAAVAGLASMLAYVLLALPPGSHGAALQRVIWIDVAAIVMLSAGWLISLSRNHDPSAPG